MDANEDEYDGPTPDLDSQQESHQVLADLLGQPDEFIRCRDMNIAGLFTNFLQRSGHPAWHADAVINELCLPPPATGAWPTTRRTTPDDHR